jgi:hypothetical protein
MQTEKTVIIRYSAAVRFSVLPHSAASGENDSAADIISTHLRNSGTGRFTNTTRPVIAPNDGSKLPRCFV